MVRQVLGLTLFFAGISGCAIPERDNASDPALRPQAFALTWSLVPVDDADSGHVVVGGQAYAATVSERGSATSAFIVDARGTTDSNTSFSKLDFEFDLANDELPDPGDGDPALRVCPGVLGSAGVSSQACRFYDKAAIAGITSAGLPRRNAPIEVHVRVEDPSKFRDSVSVFVQVDDHKPVSDAGPDHVFALDPCGVPPCTRLVELDGSDSGDSDPVDSVEIESHCWEQLERDAADCLADTAFTVITPSAVPACPPEAVASCSHVGQVLQFDADLAEPELLRLRLWVKDRYGWGVPEGTEVQVGDAPLWQLEQSPPSAKRVGAAVFAFPREFLKSASGGTATGFVRPLALEGPDGTDAMVVGDNTGAGQLVSTIDGRGIRTHFATLFVDGNGNVIPTAGGRSASGRAWISSREYSAVGGPPDDTSVMVVTTSGAPLAGLAHCFFGGGNEPPGGLPVDILEGHPDGSGWGALKGGTTLVRWTLSPSASADPDFYCDGSYPNGLYYQTFGGFTGISDLDISPDGTIWIADGDAVKALGPNGAVLPGFPDLGFVDAIRFDPVESELWVNAPASGVFALSTLTGESRSITEPVGAILAIRISEDGIAWLISADANLAYLVDPVFLEPEPVPLDGTPLQVAGALGDGSLLVTALVPATGSRVPIRLPRASTRSNGAETSSIGAIVDVSTEPLHGGAWLAVAAPPSVAEVGADGRVLSTTPSFTLGAATAPLVRPWRAAVDPIGTGLWVVDTPNPESGATAFSTWYFVSDRTAAGASTLSADATATFAPPAIGDFVVRLRPAPSERAWATTLVQNVTPIPNLVELRRSGSAIQRNVIPIAVGLPAGPAVTKTGVAWVARCQTNLASAPFAACNCAAGAFGCTAGVRLAVARQGDTSLTGFALPAGVDMGSCPGGLEPCGILPVDLLYDRSREHLWILTVDNDAVGTDPVLWRLRCSTGLALDTCAMANVQGIKTPLISDFRWPNFGDIAVQELIQAHPDMLGLDPGTGRVFLLDPYYGLLRVFEADEVEGEVAYIGSTRSQAVRLAVDR